MNAQLLVTLYTRRGIKGACEVTEKSMRIREARRRTGLTQEALARELGVTTSAVGQWEMQGGTWPSVENLSALAKRSGMAFEYLATGRGPKYFGPAVAEEPAAYRIQVQSEQEAQLLHYFRPLRASRRSALLELLRPER